jgi:hypothetical protein
MKRWLGYFRLAVVLIALTMLGATVYIYSGIQSVAADGEHRALTQWLLQTVRERSVARRARGVEPGMPAQMDVHLLHTAIIAFEDMCAACHAPPGRGSSALARGLNPPASDLVAAARQRSPAELFWVTRHGVRMTGMPAWGKTHTDAELWPLVALITRFPDLEPDEYSRLLDDARAAGVTHDHGDSEVHEPDDEESRHHHDHHDHHH